MSLTTFWQLEMYWEDDGPDYAETGREVLCTFQHKPTAPELITTLAANLIRTDADKIDYLLQGSGVLLNEHGDCAQLIEITTGK